MSTDYIPEERRKRVDMPTLSGITLDKDIARPQSLTEGMTQEPFDPSVLDEAAPAAESHSEAESNHSSETGNRKRATKSK